MIECINYEIIDRLGYSRIDGFSRYDGNVSLKDATDLRVLSDAVGTSGTAHPHSITDQPIEDADGNLIGYLFSFTSTSTVTGTIVYISFTGTKVLTAADVGAFTVSSSDYSFTETTITQAQMISLESYLSSLVSSPRDQPVGLHWWRDSLYAVVPLFIVQYEASDVNQVVQYVPYTTVTTSYSAASAELIEKVVLVAAGVATAERGYIIIRDSGVGSWLNSVADTDTLAGAITVAAGDVYHQPLPVTAEISPCNIWNAQRPATYSINKAYKEPGWTEQLDSFTVTVTLSGVVDAFNSIMLGNTEAEATYYFESTAGNSVSAVVLDYFIVSGSFAAGNAVVRLQLQKPSLNAGTHDIFITTSDDMYLEAATTNKLADVTVNQSFNYLPGLVELNEVSSRYQFITANFYAADDMDAFYGVNGVSRAFVFKNSRFSFIYTQDDSDLDIPRSLTAYCLHLALGYQRGSVLLSVVGEPTNFAGVSGASEIATGDRITGLLPLSGTTLGVFCDGSIWGITGNTVDNFQLQVIAPTTGCIEYTAVNCGQIVYMDSRGVSTLETSANYGDFVGNRMSSAVAPWLLPRCKRGTLGVKNTSGVNFAMPVRSKNQYRMFFNDGEILTMTFVTGGEKPVAFTRQRYYFQQETVTDTAARLVPFAWTSEVDSGGTERIYVSHNDNMENVVSDHVFGLEQGNSFDGQYIPHLFETNWFFGDAPIIYTGIQKLRMHGLSRGYTKLDVYAAGIQEDYSFGENVFSTASENLNLPRTAGNIYNDLLPVTNICNLANRGLGIQLRFKGSNTDLTKPEPGHICQVMVVYSRPGGGPDA